MTVDSPRRENAFSETVLTRAADVIHDLMTAVFENRITNARRERVERFVPRRAFPLSFTAFSCALEWKKNAIRIVDLIERRWSLRAIAPTRTGMFRIPLELLDLTGDLVDISKQPACRFAVETRRRNERIVPLLPLRPRPRIQLRPVIPPLLRRKRREMTPTRTRVESFFFVCAQVRYAQ